MSHNVFYFNEDKCNFEPITYSGFEKFIYHASIWLLCGIVLSGVGIIALSHFVGTPSEIALKAENIELVRQLGVMKSKISNLDESLNSLAERDNEIYRTILGIDPIAYDERLAGVGGSDTYVDFDSYSESTAKILRWTTSNVDNIERRINIQKLSFEEIKSYYNSNREKLAHIPATRPVKGVLISGFGMRKHPVYGFNRMHEGLDFRAKIGNPIYATGNGTIKFANNKGTYGKLIIINHEYGFESRFAHLSEFAPKIKAGSKIKRGDLIGYSGDTGVVEGPHLHYEIRYKNRSVDPLNYLFLDITPEEFNMFKKISLDNEQSMD